MNNVRDKNAKKRAQKNTPAVKPREDLRLPVTGLFIVASIFALYYLWFSSWPKLLSIALALVIFIVTGTIIANANGFGVLGPGLYMPGTKRGLRFIDSISRKNNAAWKFMVDWGLVLSFGLLSYFMFRKYMSKKTLAFGLISILLMELFMLPYLNLVLYTLLSVPQLSVVNTAASSYVPSSIAEYVGIIFTAITFIGGFAFFLLAELAYIGAVVLFGVLSFTAGVATGAAASVSSLPGPAGIPVILLPILDPAIALPMLCALIVLLTIHEFSHGVLARQSKVKLKRIGLIVFGLLPLGGFVEPDEKQVSRLKAEDQDRISLAGIASNYVMAVVFFALMFLMLQFVLPLYFQEGVIVTGTVSNSSAARNNVAIGSIIYQWNGHNVNASNVYKVAEVADKPDSHISLNTSNGIYSLSTNSTGKIGVYLGGTSTPVPINRNLGSSVLWFLYEFFSFAFFLNFYVAIFNLLPLPVLDGGRVFSLRLGARGTRIVMYIIAAIIILLLVPWIWILARYL